MNWFFFTDRNTGRKTGVNLEDVRLWHVEKGSVIITDPSSALLSDEDGAKFLDAVNAPQEYRDEFNGK